MNFLPRAYISLAEVQVSDLTTMTKKILSEFFPDFNGPLPTFKIVNQKTADWNGRCVFKGKNCVIELQKYILDDPKTLDRILCHELIHHVDYMANNLAERKKHRRSDEGHGQFFMDNAGRINSKRGQNYVTKISDSDFKISDSDKDFYLLIRPFKGETKLCYSMAYKVTEAQKAHMAREIQIGKAKVAISKDIQWRGGPGIGTGKVTVPEDAKTQKALRDLYDEAPEALQKKFEKIDSTKPYALLIRKYNRKFGYAHSIKLSESQKKVVEWLKEHEDARLLTTTDPQWLAGVKIKEYGGMSVPESEEKQSILKKLYEGAI